MKEYYKLSSQISNNIYNTLGITTNIVHYPKNAMIDYSCGIYYDFDLRQNKYSYYSFTFC